MLRSVFLEETNKLTAPRPQDRTRLRFRSDERPAVQRAHAFPHAPRHTYALPLLPLSFTNYVRSSPRATRPKSKKRSPTLGSSPPRPSDKCRAQKWRLGAQDEFPSPSPLTAAWQPNLPIQLRIPMHTTLVHNLLSVATRLSQHPRCQRLRMSRNQARSKRVAINAQS